MLIEKPKFVLATAIVAIAAFGYFIALSITGDPRFDDGALYFEEAAWWELILIVALLLSVFSIWFSAMHHAFSKGRTKIVLLILFVWPFSFIYGLCHAKTVGWK